MSRLDFIENRNKKYRLLYKRPSVHGLTDAWIYSKQIFKASSPEEALKQARRFWKEGKFSGTIAVRRVV